MSLIDWCRNNCLGGILEELGKASKDEKLKKINRKRLEEMELTEQDREYTEDAVWRTEQRIKHYRRTFDSYR
jgi:hypothetical protein